MKPQLNPTSTQQEIDTVVYRWNESDVSERMKILSRLYATRDLYKKSTLYALDKLRPNQDISKLSLTDELVNTMLVLC